MSVIKCYIYKYAAADADYDDDDVDDDDSDNDCSACVYSATCAEFPVTRHRWSGTATGQLFKDNGRRVTAHLLVTNTDPFFSCHLLCSHDWIIG